MNMCLFYAQNCPNVHVLFFRVEYNKFQLSEHAGTHIDAPIHFNQHGQFLHEVPLDKLIGPGVIVDISHRANRDRSAEVNVEDILRWEEDHGKIPQGAFVIMKSGWFRKYPDATQIFGVDVNRFPSTDFRFPGISPAAAQWLIDNRDINGVGGDTPSPDRGGGSHFRTHRTILGANKVILENVANLDKVPPSGATIYALPINMHRGSGGPIRIFATLNDGGEFDYSGSGRSLPLTGASFFCVLFVKLMY